MIEIGVMGGGSLAMRKEYFGPGSNIIGIDINADCKAHEGDGIESFIGSQDDPAVVDRIFSKYPNVDIVLDDGSHKMNHMISSFDLIYDRVRPNGVYIIEDPHTFYWNDSGAECDGKAASWSL